MRPTLIFVSSHFVSGKLAHYPGEECPPGLLSQENIDRALDKGWLREFDSTARPSLYRLCFRFTGATPEQPLTKQQIETMTLPE